MENQEITIPSSFEGVELNDDQINEIRGILAREKGANQAMTKFKSEIDELKKQVADKEELIKNYKNRNDEKLSEFERSQREISELRESIKILSIETENKSKAQEVCAKTGIPISFISPFLRSEDFDNSVKKVVDDFEKTKAKIIESSLKSTPIPSTSNKAEGKITFR